MGYTLFMLTYTCVENQWKNPVLNWQQIGNESTLYLFCLFLVYYSISETSVESRFTLGYVSIGVFFVWVCVNFAVIIWQALKFVKQLMKRSYYRFNNKNLAKIVSQIGAILVEDLKDEGKNIFRKDGRSCTKCLVLQQRTRYGGFRCSIVPQHSFLVDEKALGNGGRPKEG